MRIVIAEDDALLREGLALLLRAEGLDVVATAATPDALLVEIQTHRPDVAIVDVRMPPTHTDEGIRAAVEARRRQPGLAVLVLSAYVDGTRRAWSADRSVLSARGPKRRWRSVATCKQTGALLAGGVATWRGQPGRVKHRREARTAPIRQPLEILRQAFILVEVGPECRDRRLRSSVADHARPAAEGGACEHAGEHHASVVGHRCAAR